MIACRGLDFRHHIRAGGKARQDNLSRVVGDVNAVGGDSPAVVGDKGSGSRHDLELCSRQRRSRHGVSLDNDKTAFRGIPKGDSLGPVRFQHNRLRLVVHDVAVRGLDLPHRVGSRLETV